MAEDIIEKLKAEHRKVEGMLNEFSSEPSAELAVRIHDAIKAHATLEEKKLYPKLKKIDAEAVDHAKEEHDHVESLADTLKEDPGNFGVYTQLRDALHHHVAEEEKPDGLFNKIREDQAE